MGTELSMATRAEITAKYAREYKQLSKKDRGRLLDEVVSVTGWSRDCQDSCTWSCKDWVVQTDAA